MKFKHKSLSFFLIIVLCLTVFTGCIQESTTKDEITVDIKTAVLEHMASVQSVKTHITLDMKAHMGMQGSENAHTASLGSDISTQMTVSPLALHTESFSRITVDGTHTRDDREYYIVERGEEMFRYDYVNDDEWKLSTLTRADALAVPCQTGLIYDWNTFLSHLHDDALIEVINDKSCLRLSGEVPAALLQELFGKNVFDSFMYSAEMLLADMIPCMLYVDSETYYPEQVVLTFTNSFIVSDMVIDTAVATVNYSKWNEIPEIEVPKRVEVVAIDTELDFYNSFYTWSLFSPYIKVEETKDVEDADDTIPPVNSSSLESQADWSTFQVRLDGNIIQLPILYSDIEKAGYIIDVFYNSSILDTNMYMESIPLKKGSDTLYCTFVNTDDVPQQITSCYICAIDLSVENNTAAGIEICLPGNVALGTSRDALISAYGEPDILNIGFSRDTYIWNGSQASERFLAEVNPTNNCVVRIVLATVVLLA